MNIEEHYGMLLGITDPWRVTKVDLGLMAQKVDIYVEYSSRVWTCPICGAKAKGYDHLKEQIWRHLDVMQFETLIHCRLPRCYCQEHGVKTLKAPWENGRGFTIMFEAFAVQVLQAAGSIQQGAKLLRISWRQAFAIMKRAVDDGLKNRNLEKCDVTAIGIDEKSFLRGQDYATIVYSHNRRCVFSVERGRSSEVGAKAIQSAIPETLKENVKAVTMDFSAPYAKAVREELPNARIIADKFHAFKHLSDAVDKVRRQEAVILEKQHNDVLKDTRMLWLKDQRRLSEKEIARFDALINRDLKTAEAWHLKEAFKRFFSSNSSLDASRYFDVWLSWVCKSRLKPMLAVAKTFLSHLQELLNYVSVGHLTNALAEGFNSKIQAIKSAARGFRNFDNYRTSILFYCGRLSFTHSN